MKALSIALAALVLMATFGLVMPHSAHAQGGSADSPIILNDATPAIDVMINLPPDTTGVVALEIRDVVVQLLDANGNLVFETRDERIQALEFRIAPNMPQQQLIVERRLGATEGLVNIHTQLDLRAVEQTTDVVLISDSNTLAIGQEYDSYLDVNQAAETLQVQATGTEPVQISTSFPNAALTWQMVDDNNIALATLYSGAINGISVVVDAGNYEVSLLNPNPQALAIANTSIMPANADVLTVLPEDTSPDTSTDSMVVATCTTTVNVASVNLRSGPGTGYSRLNYAFRGQEFLVGGMTTEGEWVLVGLEDGSTAWMLRSLGDESGTCAELVVFDIPLRDAPEPQITFTSATGTDGTVYTDESYFGGEYDDDDAYEDDDEHEDEEHEYEDEDEHEEDDDD